MRLKISYLLVVAILLMAIQIGSANYLEFNALKQQNIAIKHARGLDPVTQHKRPDIWADYQESLQAKKNKAFIRHKEILQLDQILQSSPDSNERILAIDQLEKIGGKEALTVVAKGLGDEDALVRSQVIKTLSAMNGENTVHLLGQVLFGKEEQELKLQALEAISAHVSDAGLSLIQSVAEHETDEVIQNRAMDILNYPNGNDALPSNNEDEEDFYAILQRASFLQPEKALGALQYVMQKSPDATLREEAVLVLANSHEKEAIASIEDSLLSDKSSAVRIQAINALTNNNNETLSVLGQVLFADPDPVLRIEAIKVLALEKTPAHLAFLRQALSDPDERVRSAAGQYLQVN